MSRDERPSGSDLTSDVEQSRPRTSSGFDASNGIESIRFGCSMLSKLRFRPRNPAQFTTVRCALGYALHGTDEVAKCLAVEGPNECWKMVPNWRVAALERQASHQPHADSRHSTPHIVALEEASEHADAALVSSDGIELAEETLQESAELVEPVSPLTMAQAAGAGDKQITIETEIIQIVHLHTGTDGGTSD